MITWGPCFYLQRHADIIICRTLLVRRSSTARGNRSPNRYRIVAAGAPSVQLDRSTSGAAPEDQRRGHGRAPCAGPPSTADRRADDPGRRCGAHRSPAGDRRARTSGPDRPARGRGGGDRGAAAQRAAEHHVHLGRRPAGVRPVPRRPGTLRSLRPATASSGPEAHAHRPGRAPRRQLPLPGAGPTRRRFGRHRDPRG